MVFFLEKKKAVKKSLCLSSYFFESVEEGSGKYFTFVADHSNADILVSLLFVEVPCFHAFV